MGFRPRHDDVGIGECRPLLGQSLWPEQAPGDPKQLVGVGLAVPDAPEQRAQLARPEAVFGCPRSPVLTQPHEVDLLLALSCLDRRELGRVEAALAAAGELLLDLDPPRRELADHAARHVPKIRQALLRRLPLDPQRARELVSQMGLVEVAGGEPVGAQDRLPVERSPLLVGR